MKQKWGMDASSSYAVPTDKPAAAMADEATLSSQAWGTSPGSARGNRAACDSRAETSFIVWRSTDTSAETPIPPVAHLG